MIVGLIGHRIAYSASPAMHTAAFDAAGLEGWRYDLWDVDSDHLEMTVDRLRGDEFAGANVTIPHKQAVLSLLDRLDPLAERTGAVNTIVREGDRLAGFNTDVPAIGVALREVGWRGGRAVVLGRGGSAKAAMAALDDAEVITVTRDNWDRRRDVTRSAAVVINCTPLGRGGEVVLEPGDLPLDGAVIDLVYAPGGTPLVNSARAAGVPTADGWTVLVAQGAASFTLWTGVPAPVDAMRAALPA